MGCPSYLVSVICTSWLELWEHQGAQVVALAIGVGSVFTVVATAWLVSVGPSRVVTTVPVAG